MTPLAQRIQQTIRQDVKSMHAYAIQDSRGLIKLDAMENPFRLPEALQRELGERLGRVAINRYPVQSTAEVVAALSQFVDLPAGCKLMLGNGSDELISLLRQHDAPELPNPRREIPLRLAVAFAAINKPYPVSVSISDREP